MSSTATGVAGATGRAIEDLTLEVNQEIRVRASLDVTFEALVEQLGSALDTPDGQAMPMKLELRPGGRWYRDLGTKTGICGDTSRRSSVPRCLRLRGRCSCRIQWRRTFSGG